MSKPVYEITSMYGDIVITPLGETGITTGGHIDDCDEGWPDSRLWVGTADDEINAKGTAYKVRDLIPVGIRLSEEELTRDFGMTY